MEETPRPNVRPKEEVWILCEKLAEKHGLVPLEVLKRLVQVGECAANIEERGGEVIGRLNGKEVEIKVFSKNGS